MSCRVYWGSHGCDLPQGHNGDCWCDCCECAAHPDEDSGCVAGPPYYGPRTVFYGEDAEARGLNTDSDIIETCAHCGGDRQNDKPDPCLGMLPGVAGACCGHGDPSRAYVMLRAEGYPTLYAGEAAAILAEIKTFSTTATEAH
jgi:hypothetical protein